MEEEEVYSVLKMAAYSKGEDDISRRVYGTLQVKYLYTQAIYYTFNRCVVFFLHHWYVVNLFSLNFNKLHLLFTFSSNSGYYLYVFPSPWGKKGDEELSFPALKIHFGVFICPILDIEHQTRETGFPFLFLVPSCSWS